MFGTGFFERYDEASDAVFYAPPRLVTHLDDAAVAEVGRLYADLGLTGEVLDLMSSWVSHFAEPPARLTVLGMNELELARNPAASARVVHDLNVDPRLPFADDSFDAVTCCVSVDYLVRPVEVFTDVRRVLRPGGPLVTTFSNRCFPTKAIRGWLAASEAGRVAIVEEYFALGGFTDVRAERRNPGAPGDPLYAVWGRREQ
ncbi:MAG TPA: methyltransferase domain-containing protein [Ilumatobacteraceae bacterium]|nr:methyltransferase domain-containing protein [Ilumatobacteraceae bacterium]